MSNMPPPWHSRAIPLDQKRSPVISRCVSATEFQKILNHRGIVGADPIGALAHLQLGRAFAMSGDKTSQG
jgi:hypothetical protein